MLDDIFIFFMEDSGLTMYNRSYVIKKSLKIFLPHLFVYLTNTFYAYVSGTFLGSGEKTAKNTELTIIGRDK